MAIARGQQSSESPSRTLYKGIAAVKVLAVNPNKAELEKLYGREYDKEPEYLGEAEVTMPDGSKRKYPSARITFICKTDPDKNNGIEAIFQHTFFLQKRHQQGSKSGKYQVIDKYGRTAWGTQEEIMAKQIPQYTNGPANIDADYRPAYQNEERLTLFIKNLLNIPNVQSFVNGAWVDNAKVDKNDCLVRLDEIEKYFNGDFKELREIISYQPDNLVKICVGVRTNDEGRTTQVTYDGMSFKNAVTDYAKLDAEIQTRKANGGLSNSEFDICDLQEYVVTPTDTNELAAGTDAVDNDPWS